MSKNDPRINISIALIIFLTTLFSYQEALNGVFVWDSIYYLAGNTHITALTPENLLWMMTTNHLDNWHPVTWLSHMLDCQLYGVKRPGMHHVTSLLIHCVNTVLLFRLLNWITGGFWQAAFVALIFGIHPLHVESVAWISERLWSSSGWKLLDASISSTPGTAARSSTRLSGMLPDAIVNPLVGCVRAVDDVPGRWVGTRQVAVPVP